MICRDTRGSRDRISLSPPCALIEKSCGHERGETGRSLAGLLTLAGLINISTGAQAQQTLRETEPSIDNVIRLILRAMLMASVSTKVHSSASVIGLRAREVLILADIWY